MADPAPRAEPQPGPEQEDRRKRLAEIFGDVLPESTTDDRDDKRPDTPSDDHWYTENRPPHHDPA